VVSVEFGGVVWKATEQASAGQTGYIQTVVTRSFKVSVTCVNWFDVAILTNAKRGSSFIDV
jgi:hypothetical protein